MRFRLSYAVRETRIRDVCGKRYSEPDDVRCQCCINIDILTDSLLAVQLATYVTRRGHPRYVGKVACVSSNVPCVTSSRDPCDVHVCVQIPVHHVLLATALHQSLLPTTSSGSAASKATSLTRIHRVANMKDGNKRSYIQLGSCC